MDMETSNLQLTPEMRQALAGRGDEPLYIEDAESRKTYLLIEQGKFPELEEEYIREGLAIARDQIARGEISTASIAEVIAKAAQRESTKS
jgi:hypothetical protein